MADRHVHVAGVTTALVGFASSFAVVLAGLRGVGASPAQAATGLVALCVAQAVGMLWLTRRHRMPLTLAWSTPGAALLAASGAVEGGWPAAVGAFLVTGVLVVLTGLWPRLGALVAAVPAPIAQAMLAGVLVQLCLAPVLGLAEDPWRIGLVVVVWLAALRLAPRWAAPVAFVAALGVVAYDAVVLGGVGDPWPRPDLVAPTFGWGAVLGVALPLYVVTMASQNVPGAAVMASYGYRVPWRESMAVTGVGTLLTAPLGGHAVNLAAITAALAASPDAHPDPDQRWRAARTTGWTYLVLAVAACGLTALAAADSAGVLAAVAGLALLGTLGSSLAAATGVGAGAGAGAGASGASESREAAVVTFLVAASGITLLGIGAAFWGLLAGLLVRTVLTSPGLRTRTSDEARVGASAR